MSDSVTVRVGCIGLRVRTACSVLFVVVAPTLVAAQNSSPTHPATQDGAAERTSDNGRNDQTTDDGERLGASSSESLEPMLEEVVITATRRSERPFDLSFTTHTVTSEDIDNAFYRSTPEALRELPGIMVQKTSHGQGSPFIRGFTGFRNLMLIDGIRLNNSVFRSGPNQYWNTVDSFSLNRIEVVKGPTSVLYGSDAIGGTVNAITKGPSGYGEGFQHSQRVYYRFSSGERSSTYRYELNATWEDKLGVWLGATVKDFGSLRAGRGTGSQPNTGYDEWDADFKLEYFFNPDTRLVFAHQEADLNNVPRTHRTILAKSFKRTTIGTDLRRDLDQERRLTYVQLHAENMNSFVETMRLSLSWQEQHETRDRIRSSGFRDKQGFDVGTIGATAQFESSTPIGYLTYGVEYYHDRVNSFSTRNVIQGPVADNASYDLLGVYLQDEVSVSDRIDLVLGARINYARADANRVSDPLLGGQTSTADDWWSAVGSARLVYHVVPDHVNVFGAVSQGFRAPNLSDLTRFDSARSSEIETPALGLDPEMFISFEAGVKTQYDNWSMQAAYFHTLIDDMIVRVPTGRIVDGEFEVTKLNGGDGFVQGIELAASYRFHPQWTAFGNLTWIDGEVDTFPTSRPKRVREPISRLMPLTGLLGLRWDHPSRKIWVEGITTIADNQNDLSSRDRADTSRIPPGGTPSYTVFSLRSGWQIRENISLTAALENITDENYRIHGSGQNELGRSLNIGVSISF
jgi:outer membrane receptor protein involved in Fe transport